MNKLDKYNVKTVKLNFTTKEAWLRIRGSKVKDTKCKNCKIKYEDTNDTDIAFASIEGQVNAHLCQSCGQYFIDKGATDIGAIHKDRKDSRSELLVNIIKYDDRYSDKKPSGSYSYMDTRSLGNKTLEEVQIIHDKLKIEYDREQRIAQEIKDNYVDTPTEQYLFDDWDLFEDEDMLKHPEQIEEYFKDVGYDYFECGQGFAQEEASVYVKIGNKYYDVTINAEIDSSKQDRGDRLYWVESIESVTYEESEKMDPKPRVFTDTEILNEILSEWCENKWESKEQWMEHIQKQIIKNEK